MCAICYNFDIADIDECELADTLCENGECDNTEGSFRCICDAGYIPSNDEKSCNGNQNANFLS